MSACEKCWRDAHRGPQFSVAEEYGRLIAARVGPLACTPEEQAGPDATRCDACGRMTLHQITRECMNGCAEGGVTVDFHRDWTTFALDAEIERFGATRIAKAHNALRAQIAAARREGVIEGLEMAIRCLDEAAEAESDASGRDLIRAEIERRKEKP